MNSEHVNIRFSPNQVIVVYSDQARRDFYLEQREVRSVGGKMTLMAPMPVAEATLQDVAKAYMKTSGAEMSFETLIPDYILFGRSSPGKTVVAWYRPAMKRTLNFAAHLVSKGDHVVEVPATLYVVVNTKLYVYALMTSDRPTLATKLYNAPFFNIYSDGNVCLGTARVGVKARTFEQEADRFETAFYMAEQNGGQSTNNCKTPLPKLWTSLIRRKIAFPSEKQLLQHSSYKTLGDLFSKLIAAK